MLTGVAGLAVSLATAAILNERLSPVTAVSEGIAEITPGKVAETAISAVGTWDKPLLIGGVVLGLVGLAALAGHLAERRAWAGRLVFLAMGLLALAAVLGPGDGAGSAILPVATGTITWLVVLPVLVPTGAPSLRGRRARPPPRPGTAPPTVAGAGRSSARRRRLGADHRPGSPERPARPGAPLLPAARRRRGRAVPDGRAREPSCSGVVAAWSRPPARGCGCP